MLGTPAFRPLSALRRWLCGSLPLEPLGRLFDLRLDAGEVHTTQGHQHLMPVQGGFQRDAHWCLWKGHCGSIRLCWWWLAGWLSMAIGASVQHRLGQLLCPPGNRRTQTVLTV